MENTLRFNFLSSRAAAGKIITKVITGGRESFKCPQLIKANITSGDGERDGYFALVINQLQQYMGLGRIVRSNLNMGQYISILSPQSAFEKLGRKLTGRH
jgi:hypothetical protein